MKPLVVPDESERWTTVICVLGRFTPGFSDLIAGAFQVVILPEKMSAIIGPSSFSPVFIPGRLYETVIAPNATGKWSAGPLV